ncbi:putative transcriptional regulator [Sphingobacterium faecium PCAi_F2.5]|nr:putative transcriptional regulator [Sphingobacterium faecium PCAi_F2.5]
MVETAGGGIKKIFNYQRARFFPMPDYDLSDNKVKVTISGKVLNLNYARLLAQNKALSLEDIMALDKVQKRKPLSNQDEKELRRKKLIEGRKPNYFISLHVAQKAGDKAGYTKNKAFNNQYYRDLILKALSQHSTMSRKDIDELLWNKLPEWMTDDQRKRKVNNLITELKNHNKIVNKGSFKYSMWELVS